MNPPDKIRIPLLEKVALLMLAQRYQISEEAVLTKLIREAVVRELASTVTEETLAGDANNE